MNHQQTVASNPGFRTYPSPPPPADELVAALADASSTDLSDVLDGVYTVDGAIRPLVPLDGRIAGPALTVSVTPGNGLMIRKALRMARPGDVVVVNAFGNLERAVLGANVARAALQARVRAVVVDGVVRDVSEIATMGLPLFARGTTPRSGSDPRGRGEIGVPVACGGVVVVPNDVVVADLDGITVVPAPDAAAVADAARAMRSGSRPPTPGGDHTATVRTTADDDLAAMGLTSADHSWLRHRLDCEGRSPVP